MLNKKSVDVLSAQTSKLHFKSQNTSGCLERIQTHAKLFSVVIPPYLHVYETYNSPNHPTVTLLLLLADSAIVVFIHTADQLAGQSHPASAIRSERCSQAHLQHEAIRTHHQCTDLPSLASRSRADHLQGGHADISFSAWYGAALHDVSVYSRC